jgi:hypothetical protein
MVKKRWLFRYLEVFLLFCLGATATILSPTPCIGSESGEQPTVFSLDVKDEPLIDVLNKISKLTGYEIAVTGKWTYLPITVSIKNASIHKALNKLLRKFNHTIVVDDSKKKVTLTLYDPGVTPRQQKDIVSTRQKAADPLDVEVIPPKKVGERGVTQRQLEEMRKSQKTIDPLDIEVIPSQTVGERGVTQRQLEAMKKSQKTIDPLDIEVIPPQKVGERGITQRQLEEMRKSQKTIAPQAIPSKKVEQGEVTPKQPHE